MLLLRRRRRGRCGIRVCPRDRDAERPVLGVCTAGSERRLAGRGLEHRCAYGFCALAKLEPFWRIEGLFRGELYDRNIVYLAEDAHALCVRIVLRAWALSKEPQGIVGDSRWP